MNEICEENHDITRCMYALNKIERNNEYLSQEYKSGKKQINYLIRFINKYKHERKKCIKDLIKEFIPIFLAITLPVTAHLTINPLTKDCEVVAVNTEIYQKGELPRSTKNYEELSDAENKVYIKVIEPWNDFGERLEYTYDATSLDFDSVMDYSDYDVSKLEDTLEVKRISKTEDTETEDYTETIKQIIFETVDENDSDNLIKFLLYSIFYAIYGVTAVTLFTFSLDGVIQLFSISEIKWILSNFKNYKKEINSNKNNIKKVTLKLLKMIEKNDELRNEFVRVFNENKHLMNDPAELERRFNELINEVDTISMRKELKE